MSEEQHAEILRRINRLENFMFFGGFSMLCMQVFLIIERMK